MGKKLNLSTEKGCRKTLAILLCIVLLASLFAQLISTNFGSVKISTLTIDSRGAELDIDLYVKRNVSDSDKLPCVLLAHGRGATKNVVRGLAEDLAKRGYVVLNVNAYGMGMSEQPVSDETGNGADHFNFGDSPFGMIDALNFVRTLKYVDQTRIAMFGHSYGSARISVAATMDCGYFTLNDKKINILSDIFGLKFTEDEISQSADKLAEERLDDEQFKYYLSLADQAEKESSTRINTLVLTGATGGPAPATVTVGGHDVREFTCDSLLSNISMVFQNVYLFHDTIRNNILFGKPDASEKEMLAAAEKACCHDFISALPNGYDTVIGEGGSTLSGGEKQRISIARAILKNAPIVILDEATASVDPENEHLIQAAISELTHGKTLITIAHRLATIENASQILVLDYGRIVQKGTHAELLEQEGIYKSFVGIREKAEGWTIS